MTVAHSHQLRKGCNRWTVLVIIMGEGGSWILIGEEGSSHPFVFGQIYLAVLSLYVIYTVLSQYTFRYISWYQSWYDVIVWDDDLWWYEVRGLGQCGMGAEGTAQDATRNRYQDLGICVHMYVLIITRCESIIIEDLDDNSTRFCTSKNSKFHYVYMLYNIQDLL